MIYIMCDKTKCIHNRVYNNKFNRCFSNDVTIKNSEKCNRFYSVDNDSCKCLEYEKYYHDGQKYGRCYKCGKNFKLYSIKY